MKGTDGGVFDQNNCQVKPQTGGYYGPKENNQIIYIHIRSPLMTYIDRLCQRYISPHSLWEARSLMKINTSQQYPPEYGMCWII